MVGLKRKKIHQYSENDLKKAIEAVQNENMTQRAAAKIYGVPRATLQDRIHGRVNKSKPGPPTRMDTNLENKLVDYSCNRAAMGMGFGKLQFLRYAGSLASKYNIKFSEKTGNLPSNRWWYSFKTRHPELAYRTPEPTSSIRHQCMSYEKTKKFFHSLNVQFSKNNLTDMPGHIWNMDETGLQLTHKPGKVVARKGSKYLQSRTSGNREMITCIATISAAGECLPPHLIAKGKTKRALDGFNTRDAPSNANWSVSNSGWTKVGIAKLWFTETFLPNIGPERPQLLLSDGHDAHNFIELIEIARENNIILVELPAHTSHWLQPCDRSCFGPLKKFYNSECDQLVINFPGTMVSKGTFCGLFKRAWEKAMRPENIKNGFLACGIYPLNHGAIPNEAYLPNQPFIQGNCEAGETSATAPTEPEQPAAQLEKADMNLNISDIIEKEVLGIDSLDDTTAILAIEAALTESQKTCYLYCLEKGIDLSESMFQTWKKLKEKVNTENINFAESVLSENLQFHIISSATGPTETNTNNTEPETDNLNDNLSVQVSTSDMPPEHLLSNAFPFNNCSSPSDKDKDVLPYPSATSKPKKRQTNKQMFFVLTSDEAYETKKRESEEKERKQKEKEKRQEARKEKAEKRKCAFATKQRKKCNKKDTTESEPQECAAGETWACVLCEQMCTYPLTESWIQCGECKGWAHEACTDGVGSDGSYTCDLCRK